METRNETKEFIVSIMLTTWCNINDSQAIWNKIISIVAYNKFNLSSMDVLEIRNAVLASK